MCLKGVAPSVFKSLKKFLYWITGLHGILKFWRDVYTPILSVFQIVVWGKIPPVGGWEILLGGFFNWVVEI